MRTRGHAEGWRAAILSRTSCQRQKVRSDAGDHGWSAPVQAEPSARALSSLRRRNRALVHCRSRAGGDPASRCFRHTGRPPPWPDTEAVPPAHSALHVSRRVSLGMWMDLAVTVTVCGGAYTTDLRGRRRFQPAAAQDGAEERVDRRQAVEDRRHDINLADADAVGKLGKEQPADQKGHAREHLA